MYFGSASKDIHEKRMSEYSDKLDKMDLQELVSEFFTYLDYEEETDSGVKFNPVTIGSDRVLLTEPLSEVLKRMRMASSPIKKLFPENIPGLEKLTPEKLKEMENDNSVTPPDFDG